MHRITQRTLLAIAGMLTAFATCAQPYPEPGKVIRYIVGFPAGSTIDNVSRVLLDNIRERTGSNIVVENRPGALGVIGVQAVAKAPADGYTLGPSSSATHSSGPYLSKAAAEINPLQDFTHLGRFVRFDVLVVADAKSPYTTAAALIAAARSRPGTLSYGYGSGTGQVVGAAFARAADITMLGVPYKGQPAALTDLIGGRIDYVAADLGAVLQHVQAKRLVAIALASAQRSSILPDVPTASELGLAQLNLAGWIGVMGPANLPDNVIAWWEEQLKLSMAQPQVIERLKNMAMEPDRLDGQDFQRFVKEQFTVWGETIKDANIQRE